MKGRRFFGRLQLRLEIVLYGIHFYVNWGVGGFVLLCDFYGCFCLFTKRGNDYDS
jgi:hypothetical protein